MFIFISHSIFYLLQLSYLFLVYPANSKNTIMTDEELRKFCLKQAVLISINKQPPKGFGFNTPESVSLFDLSNMIFEYVKSGATPPIKINFPIGDTD